MVKKLIDRRTKLLSSNCFSIRAMFLSEMRLLVSLSLILLLSSIGTLSFVKADELQEKGKKNITFSGIHKDYNIPGKLVHK